MRATPPAENAHHIIKFIYLQAKMQDMSMRELAKRAGVSYNSYKDAKRGVSNIHLWNVEALMNVLGYTMKPSALTVEKTRKVLKQTAAAGKL